MTLVDPIGDMFTRIRNGQMRNLNSVNIPASKFRSKILGAGKNGNYWASGISVVAHMKNPKIPAMHFNTRFIVTKKSWFGGGIDLTPSFKDKKEEIYFHSKLKELCNNNRKNYNKYKIWCDKYFFFQF